MRLRKIELKDSESIFSWMGDDIKPYLNYLYPNSNAGIIDFIKNYQSNMDEVHFVIADDDDNCEGAVNLTNIDLRKGIAELSIVVNRKAMGKGYAWFGVVEILKYAFEKVGLERIYWHVRKDNDRANRFFIKHGFGTLDEDVPREIVKNYEDDIWFAVLKYDDFENIALSRGKVSGCKIIKINTIPTIEAGELSFFEADRDISFEIKRIYYISKVPEGARRGYHAHKNLKQVLFCPFGKIQLILDNGRNGGNREEITLNDPSIGIVIDRPVWREMLWMQKNSVLVVAASDYYDENDYIRNYRDFINLISLHE